MGLGRFKYRLPIGVDMTEEVKNGRPVEVYVIDKSLKLSAKQEKFVYRFLVHGNGTQAAIEAKYTKKSAGVIACENLKKPNIAKAIEDGKWFYQYQNGIEASWVREQMRVLFERCMQAVPVEKWDPEKKEYYETGEYVFQAAAAKSVLELMAKDNGMIGNNVKVIHEGEVHHQHDHVKKKLEFNKVREKVSQHRPERVH